MYAQQLRCFSLDWKHLDPKCITFSICPHTYNILSGRGVEYQTLLYFRCYNSMDIVSACGEEEAEIPGLLSINCRYSFIRTGYIADHRKGKILDHGSLKTTK